MQLTTPPPSSQVPWPLQPWQASPPDVLTAATVPVLFDDDSHQRQFQQSWEVFLQGDRTGAIRRLSALSDRYPEEPLPLLVLSYAQPGECIFGVNIGEAILNGLKSAVLGLFNWVYKTVKDAIVWAATKIRDQVTKTATDMFAAISAAGAGVRRAANQTLQEIFDTVKINQTDVLLKMMHTGPLPPEYYFRKVHVDEEIKFLDLIVDIIRWMTFGALGVLLLCNFIILVLCCCYCLTKKELNRTDSLEDEVTEMLQEEEDTRKALRHKEMETVKEKRKEYMEMLLKGGGPMGAATARPPRGMF